MSVHNIFGHPLLEKMPAIRCLEGNGNGQCNSFVRACLIELTKKVIELHNRSCFSGEQDVPPETVQPKTETATIYLVGSNEYHFIVDHVCDDKDQAIAYCESRKNGGCEWIVMEAAAGSFFHQWKTIHRTPRIGDKVSRNTSDAFEDFVEPRIK